MWIPKESEENKWIKKNNNNNNDNLPPPNPPEKKQYVDKQTKNQKVIKV